MRVELIGHFQPCMTEIYLHIGARMADYIHTHPYYRTAARPQDYTHAGIARLFKAIRDNEYKLLYHHRPILPSS